MRSKVVAPVISLIVLGLALAAVTLVREKERAREMELITILGDASLYSRKTTGRWSLKDRGRPFTMTDEQDMERLSRLSALPYLQGYNEAPESSGVTKYVPEKSFKGINLFVSGHAQGAFAMDMRGHVLHEWSCDIDEIWPEVPKTVHSSFWRRAYWYSDGSVLAIYEGIGLVKLSRDSRILWAYKGNCHHDAFVSDEGSIYVLTRRATVDHTINPDAPVLIDAVEVLNPDGRPVERLSII